jgi:peptidoglycan/xylan/chitin deacetylase (PgdA/CDA1 family)
MIQRISTRLVTGLQRSFVRMGRDAVYRLGYLPSALRGAKGSRILVFHGLCAADRFRYNTLFITPKMFEAQLKMYKKYFEVVSLEQFYRQDFRPGKFTMCLTFDDGFANNYKYVLPLLEAYKIPATFFVTSIRAAGYDILWNDLLSIAQKHGPARFSLGDEVFIKDTGGRYISKRTRQALKEILRSTGFEAKAHLVEILAHCRHDADEDYWLQMNEEQIRALASGKWATVGSHGYYHNDLAQLDPSSLRYELAASKSWLENITNKEVKSLAFPYGSCSPAVISEAKAAGYAALLATESVPFETAEPCLKQRLTINPFISPLNQLYANVAGNYE